MTVKEIKKVSFKAKIAAYSQSIGKTFNAKGGFFEPAYVGHEFFGASFRTNIGYKGDEIKR